MVIFGLARVWCHVREAKVRRLSMEDTELRLAQLEEGIRRLVKEIEQLEVRLAKRLAELERR